MANRSQPGVEDLIGFFVNTVALRVDARDDPTIEVLLARVRRTCLDAFGREALPFERVVESLDVGDNRSVTFVRSPSCLMNACSHDPMYPPPETVDR